MFDPRKAHLLMHLMMASLLLGYSLQWIMKFTYTLAVFAGQYFR